MGGNVALLLPAGEPTAQHLRHGGEVVRAVVAVGRVLACGIADGEHLEPAVVGLLGQPVLHDHHRAHVVGPLDVRHVEALDPQRRLGEGERVLERGQGPRARVVITRSLELVARERLTGVVGHRPEQLTLRPPLRHAHAHA